jgi:hypothetical protein
MDFDFDCAAASPGGQWVGGESASRRRQRRLSSPSLRAYLTPAFDAVAAAGYGAVPGSPASSYSSGGLELGFDASLLRYRRACFSANADMDSRRLLYSPPAQARPVYGMPDHDALLADAYLHGPKRQVIMLLPRSNFQQLCFFSLALAIV